MVVGFYLSNVLCPLTGCGADVTNNRESTTMSEPSLRRYTNLSATLHILQKKCLTLLSPSSWDDRNDAFFMAEFQTRSGAKSVLALCFAEAPETYHHWRVFSAGSEGVCLEFDKDKLRETEELDNRFTCKSVEYRTINVASKNGIAVADLPFVKRYQYKDEKEFRILFVDKDVIRDFEQLKISLDWIKRITLSPWMPKPLVKTVKSTLKGIKGCKELEVYRSTLIENERWKRVANPKLK